MLLDTSFVLLKAEELLAKLNGFTAAIIMDKALFHGANFDLCIYRIFSNPLKNEQRRLQNYDF